MLFGPSGTGKTITVKLIAEAEGLSYVTWQPKAIQTKGQFDVSYANQLKDFFIQNNKASGGLKIPGFFTTTQKQVLVVDSLPNLHTKDQETSFKEALNLVQNSMHVIVVFILSDYTQNKITSLFGGVANLVKIE